MARATGKGQNPGTEDINKVTQKGQVLIPGPIRKRMGIKGGTAVKWEFVDGKACISVVEPTSRFSAALGVAKGKGLGLSADEILDMTRGKDR